MCATSQPPDLRRADHDRVIGELYDVGDRKIRGRQLKRLKESRTKTALGNGG